MIIFIYLICKKELKLNKLVLFSGTPCQVTALRNFLGREYDNLITNKIYIGYTSRDIKRRFYEHKWEAFNSDINNNASCFY